MEYKQNGTANGAPHLYGVFLPLDEVQRYFKVDLLRNYNEMFAAMPHGESFDANIEII